MSSDVYKYIGPQTSDVRWRAPVDVVDAGVDAGQVRTTALLSTVLPRMSAGQM